MYILFCILSQKVLVKLLNIQERLMINEYQGEPVLKNL